MTASTPSLSSRAHARRTRTSGPDLAVRSVQTPAPVSYRVPNLLLAGVSHADAPGLTAALGRHYARQLADRPDLASLMRRAGRGREVDMGLNGTAA